MLQFGMPTLIENQTLKKNIDLCTELGLQFIELNMNFPEYQIGSLEKTDVFLEAAQHACIYYTIHLDENLDIADFNPLVSKAYLETVCRTIEVSKKLIPLKNMFGNSAQPMILNMHLNHGIHITLPDRKVQMYERNFDIYMRSFTEFCSSCEDWIGSDDVRISIENTDGFRDYEKEVIECLLESPVFTLTWDIGHSKAVHEKDVPFILKHQDHLAHFHIHDGTEEPSRNHLALGDGEIDLKDRLNLAEKLDARCVLETKTAEALRQSVSWLREHAMF